MIIYLIVIHKNRKEHDKNDLKKHERGAKLPRVLLESSQIVGRLKPSLLKEICAGKLNLRFSLLRWIRRVHGHHGRLFWLFFVENCCSFEAHAGEGANAFYLRHLVVFLRKRKFFLFFLECLCFLIIEKFLAGLYTKVVKHKFRPILTASKKLPIKITDWMYSH